MTSDHIHIVDVETTGLDPATDRVVEIAAVKVELDGAAGPGWVARSGWQSFANPGRAIPPEASAIHHIIDADVSGAPLLGNAVELVIGPDWPNGIDIVAAHNARFDREFLPMLRDQRWIDTYRCALHVWPDAPSHSNMTLRYWLGIDLPREGAHRALADATVTAHLLIALLKDHTVDELLKLSTKAVVLRKVRFGKHVGKTWAEVPLDYLVWLGKQDTSDPDVKFTVKHELQRRKEDA
jgi:exodeoxyribonuclease X